MRIRLEDEIRTVLEAVLFVFIVLKLTNVIAWSWFYVLMPFWIPSVLSIIILIYLKCVTNYGKK
jgi:hypothetical protein